MKRIFLVVFGVLFSAGIFALPAHAGSVEPRGPENSRFGVGAYLGDPVGFTAKFYLTDRVALDSVLAWSFVDESFTMIGDVTYDIFELAVKKHQRDVSVPFYVGAGAKVAFDEDSNGDDETTGGMRIPVGLAVQWKEYPVEAFVELAPGVQFAPETEFDFTGGIGARFYFF